MKKVIKIERLSLLIFVLIFGISSIAFGKSISENKISPEEYGKKAIKIMDRSGLYSKTKEWKEAKEIALKEIKDAKSYEDTYPALKKAIKVAGGKHSFINEKPLVDENQETVEIEYPKTEYKNNILTIKMPEYIGNEKQGQRYADIISNAIVTSKNLKGVIVDLSENTGGNMGPMLAGLAPLLPDGNLMYFENRWGSSPVKLTNGKVMGGGTPTRAITGHIKVNVPVAIITGENTASSAEATLISFMGLDYVKTFGSSTAGFASANSIFPLDNGAQLILTVAKNKSRTGEIFAEDPIEPDMLTEKPIEEAIKWIDSQK